MKDDRRIEKSVRAKNPIEVKIAGVAALHLEQEFKNGIQNLPQTEKGIQILFEQEATNIVEN
jgi:hypothetical protein